MAPGTGKKSYVLNCPRQGLLVAEMPFFSCLCDEDVEATRMYQGSASFCLRSVQGCLLPRRQWSTTESFSNWSMPFTSWHGPLQKLTVSMSSRTECPRTETFLIWLHFLPLGLDLPAMQGSYPIWQISWKEVTGFWTLDWNLSCLLPCPSLLGMHRRTRCAVLASSDPCWPHWRWPLAPLGFPLLCLPSPVSLFLILLVRVWPAQPGTWSNAGSPGNRWTDENSYFESIWETIWPVHVSLSPRHGEV